VGLFDEELRTVQDYEMWFRMAKFFRFHHLSHCLIQSRCHADQGTITLQSKHLEECNQLYINFLDEIALREPNSKEVNLNNFFIKAAISLKKRSFKRAAQHSLKLALQNSSSSPSFSNKIRIYLSTFYYLIYNRRMSREYWQLLIYKLLSKKRAIN
jgi:predicted ATPase